MAKLIFQPICDLANYKEFIYICTHQDKSINSRIVIEQWLKKQAWKCFQAQSARAKFFKAFFYLKKC